MCYSQQGEARFVVHHGKLCLCYYLENVSLDVSATLTVLCPTEKASVYCSSPATVPLIQTTNM